MSLLGFQRVERVQAWVPAFLFPVLFALSTDYRVFLPSRIREWYARRGDTVDAVVHGIASTDPDGDRARGDDPAGSVDLVPAALAPPRLWAR